MAVDAGELPRHDPQVSGAQARYGAFSVTAVVSLPHGRRRTANVPHESPGRPLPDEVDLVVRSGRAARAARSTIERHRPVAGGVDRLELERPYAPGAKPVPRRSRMRTGAARARAPAPAAGDVAAEEDDEHRQDRRREQTAVAVAWPRSAGASSRASAPPRARARAPAVAPPRRAARGVDAAARALAGRLAADQLVEVRHLPHRHLSFEQLRTSGRARSASASSPCRAAGGGTRPPRSATARSSTRARAPRAPALGSSSSARCTRQATYAVSAPLRRAQLARDELRRLGGRLAAPTRKRSTIALRATAYSHDARRTALGAGTTRAERQIAAKASCTASSARPRSPQPPQREPEDRADVAVVEQLERQPVALADLREQVGVAHVGRRFGPVRRDRAQMRCGECELHVPVSTTDGPVSNRTETGWSQNPASRSGVRLLKHSGRCLRICVGCRGKAR